MPGPNKLVLSRRAVDALPVAGREAQFWDRDLTGFGVRVHPSGSKVYMVQTRARGKRGASPSAAMGSGRPNGLGARRDGCLPASRRRDAAPAGRGLALGQRADGRRDGRAVHDGARRRALQADDPAGMPRHPGPVPAAALRDASPERGHADHVSALHYRMRATPTMANQTVSLLSRLFYTAAKTGEAPAGGNPCRLVQKYPTRGRERFLSEQEFDRLGRVLAELEAAGTVSTSAAGRCAC